MAGALLHVAEVTENGKLQNERVTHAMRVGGARRVNTWPTQGDVILEIPLRRYKSSCHSGNGNQDAS